MKFVCTVCGYVYEGDAAPAECPVCHVGADKFKKVEGDLTLAAEHEYGVYAKTVKNNTEISEEDKKYIFDQSPIVKAILKSVSTGRRQLMKKQSMQLNSLKC